MVPTIRECIEIENRIRENIWKTMRTEHLRIPSKIYAENVRLGYEKGDPVCDILQFTPDHHYSISGVEKGYFTGYMIAANVQDIYDMHRTTFPGEKNYIVTTMRDLKAINQEMESGRYEEYLRTLNINASVGIMCIVPRWKHIRDEVKNQTDMEGAKYWHVEVARKCSTGIRKRSMQELFYLMLQAREYEENYHKKAN